MARALFIGLGGSGVITVGHVKAKFLSRFGLAKDKLAEQCRFLFIDSDKQDLDKVEESYRSLCGNAWIENGERISLGRINPFLEYEQIISRGVQSPAGQRLLEWVDGRGALSLHNFPMERGAGANRQQGRIGLWALWTQIENAVKTAISALSQAQDPGGAQTDPLTVYLVSGTCGGTGSSMFLDMANLIHRAYHDTFANAAGVDLVGALFMPHEYLQIGKRLGASEETLRRFASNGEAFFSEMEALLEARWNGNGKAFDELAVRPLAIGTAGVFSVFSYAFCMDTVTDLRATLTRDQMYSSAGRALYHWAAGRIGGQVNAATVNTLQADYAHDRSAGGLVPAFAVLGYRELRYPEEYMERYFEKRFLVELFDGLVGQNLDRIWPSEQDANDFIKKTWEKLVGAYLQAKHAQLSLPNLERDATVLANQGLSVPLGSFNDARGKADKTKIKNQELLGQLSDTALYLQKTKVQDLDSAWKSSPWSSQDLLRRIEEGLGAEVEQIILRWGLHAAQEVVARWDTLCQEAIATPQPDNDLQERIANIHQEIQRLEADIQQWQRKCLDKGKLEDLQKLSNAYHQKIEKVLGGWVLQRQVDILKTLSQGQTGILDRWRERLGDMIRECHGRYEEAAKSYATLAKAFMETEQDATTVFLPRVASFVEGGSWLADHLFSQLYERCLLSQVSAAGTGKTPKRFGASQGLAAEHEGLHKAIEEMLASKVATGADGGYHDGETICFFRQALPLHGRNSQWEAPHLAGELESVGARYIALKAAEEKTIGEEKNRTLHDRYRSLAEADRREIARKFSPDNVQFFCPMQNHEAQVHCVYCGADATLALALELGFDEKDRRMAWVGGESSNVLVLLKSGFRYALDGYPERADYRKAFEDSLRASIESGVAFVPHIDARFTRDGVRNVLRLMGATALTEEEKRKLYSLAILWRSLGTEAEWGKLLGRILNLNPRFVAEEKREISPLLIEAPPSGGDKHVYVCTHVEMVEGKSAFLRKYFDDCGPARNHHEAFGGIKGKGPYPWAGLASFAEIIRSRGDMGWVQLIKNKCNVLCQGLLAQAGSHPALAPFYNELYNSLITEVDALVAELNRRVAQGVVAPGPSPVATPPDVDATI